MSRRSTRLRVGIEVVLAVAMGLWAGYAWGSDIQSPFWPTLACLGFTGTALLYLSDLRDET